MTHVDGKASNKLTIYIYFLKNMMILIGGKLHRLRPMKINYEFNWLINYVRKQLRKYYQ